MTVRKKNRIKSKATANTTSIVKYANTTAKPKKVWVNPETKWIRDKELVADLRIQPEDFVSLVNIFADVGQREVSGYMFQEEGVVKWFFWSGTGTAGNVINKAEDEVKAQIDAGKNGFWVNVQFHTHPGIGTFWSTTDLDNQYERVDMMSDEDEMHVIVFDGACWLVRLFKKSEGVVSYKDGDMYIAGCSDPLPRNIAKPVLVAKPVVVSGAKKPKHSNNGIIAGEWDDWNDWPGGWENEGDWRFDTVDVRVDPGETQEKLESLSMEVIEAYDGAAMENETEVIMKRFAGDKFINFYYLVDIVEKARKDVANRMCEMWEDALAEASTPSSLQPELSGKVA